MQEITRKHVAENKNDSSPTFFLKRCPECHSKLENDLFNGFQYCTVCGYWTRKETARLEPLMILE
jgi:uncharacterized protein (DUF983 family)